MRVTYDGPLAPPITVRPAGTDQSYDYDGTPLDVPPAVGKTLVDTGEWTEAKKAATPKKES